MGAEINRNVESFVGYHRLSPKEAVKPGSFQEVVEPTKDPRILQSRGYSEFIMCAKTQ